MNLSAIYQDQPIDPLRLYQDEVFVRAGLTAGERVCITPLQTVIDGMRVIAVTDNSGAGAPPTGG